MSVSSVTNYHKESKFRALNALKDEVQVNMAASQEGSKVAHALAPLVQRAVPGAGVG